MSFYDDDESIYGLIAQTQTSQAKGSSYKSKFNPKAPPSFSTFGFYGTSKVIGNVDGHMEEGANDGTHPAKKANGTFGRTVGTEINPKQFLRKTDQSLPEKAVSAKRPALKAAIPARDDKPVMGLKTDKNFVVANAVENILAVPKKTGDDRENRAVDKGGYGKVPTYIHRTKKELATQHSLKIAAQDQMASAEAIKDMQELSEEDAIELREGLKNRWELLNKQFTTMSFTLETRSQLKRKEHLETQLHQIEAAMTKLNKRHIFVCNDK